MQTHILEATAVMEARLCHSSLPQSLGLASKTTFMVKVPVAMARVLLDTDRGGHDDNLCGRLIEGSNMPVLSLEDLSLHHVFNMHMLWSRIISIRVVLTA